ncbi:MAG: hypothetical protein E2O52_00895 [Gammaproteobacteria bacterium]|nr:MAG: hypothetical protein E2O52_00895 [Gammaproteobacteria bacterium]
MKTVIADKIASVAQHRPITRKLQVSADIPCEEGVLVAVRILNNKSTYNTLELTSGRMAKISRGDIIVGALGHRKALFGYSGHLPEQLTPGDIVQVLNIGGVLGICDSVNANFGAPFDAEVLGTVQEFPYLGERIGVPARAGTDKFDAHATVATGGIPVVVLAGTSMDSGKTAAASAIISRLRHLGFTVDGFKATGVSLRRDILAMEDAGARNTSIFTDFGVVTTTGENGPPVTRMMLTRLAAEKPDVIVFELGDGLLGAYGVEQILRDKSICECISCLVLCANDPVAAWGGVKLLREDFGLEPHVVTGPATDNLIGTELIAERLKLPAFNAITHGAALGDAVARQIGLQEPAT